MPRVNADEIITQQHIRTFIQFGGPRPGNAPRYAGQDAQYIVVDGVSIPDAAGGSEPIWVPDPTRLKAYRLAGRKRTPPELAQANLIMLEKHGAIPRQLQRLNCPLNVYMPAGPCRDVSDFQGGWADYVLILSNGVVSGNKDGGARTAWDADEQVSDTLPMTWSEIYPIGGLSFGEHALTTITLEVRDVVYCGSERCGTCGPENDGTKRIYAVTESSGSTPGTAPRLIYSTDGGQTWTQGSIDGLGETEDPVAIDCVGPYLVVLTRIAGGALTGGYYYAEINDDTGVPGTWTKVTSGFVASAQPNDIFVLSPREVFIVGDGGYIYKASDITAGVSVVSAGTATTNILQRIHGDGEETLVAVGNSGTVIKSVNRGATWAATTASPVAATLQAVAALDEKRYWTGTATGTLWYTLDGGASWTQKTFSGSGSGAVRDIVFATDEVGYMSHDTATPTARIFATHNGGESWGNTSPRLLNLPTFDRANRLAVPDAHASVAANNLAVAGLAGDGSDGILLLGTVSRL